MKVRYLNETDYDTTLCKWWSDWRWTPPSRDMLPENGSGGIMVYKDEVEICAGFIFLTNSKTAWVEFIVSNIEYKDKENRKLYLSTLVNSLGNILKNVGAKYTYVSLKNESLIKIYEELGYVKGSKGCLEMIKQL